VSRIAEQAVVELARPAILRIRWRIFSFLFGFGLVAYLQQKSLTIAAERMMPELNLTHLQIGWLEQAFVLGYAAFQLPGGLFGQRVGARAAFTIFGLVAFLAVIMTPAAPFWLSGTTLFVALLSAQLLLGFSQGGIFPVSAGVVESWFPVRQWSEVQGLQTAGLGIGAALTPPLIASMTATMGWQSALAWSSSPALLMIGLWYWYARNAPHEHPGITSAELAELDGQPECAAVPAKGRRLRTLFADRNTLLLALSYLAMNYSFYLLSNWCFLYLIEERHFSSLQSGWLSMGPPLAAAAGAGIGGFLTGRLCTRYGRFWGFRLVPLLTLPVSAGLLLIAVYTDNPYAAVAALTACFGSVELTEGAYWATAMTVGRGDTMAVSGIMNTGGNLGGIIGIPIVAYLSGIHAWRLAFIIGSIAAVASALMWLGIDPCPEKAAEPTA
jgi:ACS family glucarate transporter-like MFS transporter